MSRSDLQQLNRVAQIVSAYTSQNFIEYQKLPNMITGVYAALERLNSGVISSNGTVDDKPPEPAVPVEVSIKPDYLICLEDGLKFKSMKRHLMARYGLTPDAYRRRWNLPLDYPMVSPNYSKRRKEIASRPV